MPGGGGYFSLSLSLSLSLSHTRFSGLFILLCQEKLNNFLEGKELLLATITDSVSEMNFCGKIGTEERSV